MGLFRRRQNRESSSEDMPAARGADECGLDYVMIPGARGNASRIGTVRVLQNYFSLECCHIVFCLTLGTSYDRFCGGHLNVKSGAEGNTAVYAPVTSEILSLQVKQALKSETFMTTVIIAAPEVP